MRADEEGIVGPNTFTLAYVTRVCKNYDYKPYVACSTSVTSHERNKLDAFPEKPIVAYKCIIAYM